MFIRIKLDKKKIRKLIKNILFSLIIALLLIWWIYDFLEFVNSPFAKKLEGDVEKVAILTKKLIKLFNQEIWGQIKRIVIFSLEVIHVFILYFMLFIIFILSYIAPKFVIEKFIGLFRIYDEFFREIMYNLFVC